MRKKRTSTEHGAVITPPRSLFHTRQERADALGVGADVALPVARLRAHLDDALPVGVADDDDEIVLEAEEAAGVVAFQGALVLIFAGDLPPIHAARRGGDAPERLGGRRGDDQRFDLAV